MFSRETGSNRCAKSCMQATKRSRSTPSPKKSCGRVPTRWYARMAARSGMARASLPRCRKHASKKIGIFARLDRALLHVAVQHQKLANQALFVRDDFLPMLREKRRVPFEDAFCFGPRSRRIVPQRITPSWTGNVGLFDRHAVLSSLRRA